MKSLPCTWWVAMALSGVAMVVILYVVWKADRR